jgi:hypothetical protein
VTPDERRGRVERAATVIMRPEYAGSPVRYLERAYFSDTAPVITGVLLYETERASMYGQDAEHNPYADEGRRVSIPLTSVDAIMWPEKTGSIG